MKWWLLMTMALAGGGCATSAAGFGLSGAAPRPPAEVASPEVSVDSADAPPEQPDVVVTATSPTDVQFRADARDVVVRVLPRRPNPRRKAAIEQGMAIGTVIGVVAGFAAGAANDRQQSMSTAEHDTLGSGPGPILGATACGAIGLGLGAAVGAIVGRLAYP
jgi:hypothetical protein